MTPFRSLPWAAQVYLAAVIVVGLIVVALGWIVHPVPSTTVAYATLLYLVLTIPLGLVVNGLERRLLVVR